MMDHRPGRRSGKLIVKLIFLLAVLAAGAGGGFLFARNRTTPTSASPQAPAPAPTALSAAPLAAIDLGQFLVNVEAAGGLHYLRADVALQLDAPPTKQSAQSGAGEDPQAGDDKPKLPPGEELLAKDTIVTVLSSSRFEALRSAEGKEKLKAQLLQALQTKLPDCRLHQILLVSFVMQ